MKIKSLLLGSVAAAGLSTGAFAADLGVLTSLDVCDNLGLSGLTISSDTNCLQITGEVKYAFTWGDYKGDNDTSIPTAAGDVTLGTTEAGAATVPVDGFNTAAGFGADFNNDWESRVDSWIKFVATANSDFGPAKAVLKLKDVKQTVIRNEAPGVLNAAGTALGSVGGSDTGGVIMDEAYVAIGDSTMIMAGKKGTIMNLGDDVPLNFLGLFNSEEVDVGVKWSGGAVKSHLGDGGHVIQITSDLGNGLSVSAGLENLGDTVADEAGTAVGVLAYAGDGIAAHLTVVAGGILDGVVENYGFHAGFSGTFDIVKVVAAVAGDDTGYWNALASASATFDMFTLAISGEAANDLAAADTDYGFGASASAAVTDGVTIKIGGRWYHDASSTGGITDFWQAEAALVAAVTETLTLTGKVGVYGDDVGASEANTMYGGAEVAWAPGGGFTSSLGGTVYGNGAYKATFKAAKTFE